MSSRNKHITVYEGGSIHRPKDKWKQRKVRGGSRSPLAAAMNQQVMSLFRSSMPAAPRVKVSLPVKRGTS